MYFSKSKYCDFCQCGKNLWLKKYRPEVFEISEKAKSRFAAGSEVGKIAQGYFGEFVDVTERDGDSLDLSKMIANTKEEIAKNTPVICEAAFSYNGLYCAVDILRREDDGWSIYEVKSSTSGTKNVYYQDVAYQKYVLEHCGIKVNGTYVMCIDSTYVFDGKLDLHKFFKITDVSEAAAEKITAVEDNLKRAEEILESTDEPDIDIGMQCKNPYDCGFWNYCTRNLPKPNVFDIRSMNFDRKLRYYNDGVISFEDLENKPEINSDVQKRQIDHCLNDRETYVNKDELRAFLSELTYPIYFLDFEGVQPVVPKYIGSKPYAQIPFQYSLHYIENEGGKLLHKEFLVQTGCDPLRPIADALCRDIPMNASVLVYNKSYECDRLKELAQLFPDLSKHLLNIRSNVKDLYVPFQKGWYYNKRMGGSFTIKSVLPAIFPDDPTLDYHNLEGVHNGGEAMSAFSDIENLPQDEQEKLRENLLKYCGLDTLALVKIWQELNGAVK